ncbi:MAG: glycosyltransferase family 39 protein [Deltaproteobacteria bacterium]|nr:glycosyltransferase family 39 protein [Deltaproteobacteria bacterium]
MIPLLIASLLLSWACGFLLTSLLCPPRENGADGRALRLFIGGGLGLGISSCSYFICLWAGHPRLISAVDLGLLLLLVIAGFARVRGALLEWRQPSQRAEKPPGFLLILAGIFSLELIASAASFFFAWLKEPHGRWDAWLIWNMHARFLFRGGDHWRDAFASGLDWSHWDYPLLLPLGIARSWQYMGGEGLSVPAVIAFLFTVMTVGLLCSALFSLRGRSHGYLAGMVLLGTPFFIMMGASQFADVPFAFFVLATFVLLALYGRSTDCPGALILAGLAAGLCAWTKNEGLLFVMVVTVSFFAMAARADGWRTAVRRTALLLAGALPALLMVVWFKTQLAPANDLVSGAAPAAIAARLTDFGRYGEIAKAFFFTGLSFTQGLVDVRVGMRLNPGAVSVLLLAAYLLLAGLRIDGRDRPGLVRSAAILGLMLIGYFFVYVLTPLDLGYHLTTSLNRLFLQFWPGGIFLCFMMAGVPESDPYREDQPGAPAGPVETATARGSKPRKAGKPK